MRDAIAGAWLYSLVLIFIVVLVSFISITINYNKTYKLKTEVVNIIEEYQGVNPDSVKRIYGFLESKTYNLRRYCKDVFREDGMQYLGITKGVVSPVFTRNKSNPAGEATAKPEEVCVSRSYYISPYEGNSYADYYYDVYLAFSFSLPVIGDIFKFTVGGSTNSIYYPVDSNGWAVAPL